MDITVVIPAHNEEKFIARCLASIDDQHLPEGMRVKKIVVLNRCTDNTEETARAHGANTIVEDAENLSKIKNAGVAVADTQWCITIDADSWLSPGVLAEIHRLSMTPDCLGGGIKIKPERSSAGILVGYAMMLIPAFFMGLSFGMYWFRKSDFDAIGGFDENRLIAEDVDFLRRLKVHGRQHSKKYNIIKTEVLTTSCRKFDQFGDWHFLRTFWNPCKVRNAIMGLDQQYTDKNWYRVKR